MVGQICSKFITTYTKHGLEAVSFSCLAKLDTPLQPKFISNREKQIKNIYYNLIVTDKYYSQYILDNAESGSDVYIMGNLSYIEDVDSTMQQPFKLEVDVEIISLLPDMKDMLKRIADFSCEGEA
jgi:hypothetical protein